MDLFEELYMWFKVFANNFHGAEDFAHGNYYYLKIFIPGSLSLAWFSKGRVFKKNNYNI
jgi:hypothetical protein